MNDSELLQLAAKAAEYQVRGPAHEFVAYLTKDDPHLVIANEKGGDSVWNPITDDGDALRLAVKLGYPHMIGTWLGCYLGKGEYEADPCAATRRAIVRAAAAIGKTMP